MNQLAHLAMQHQGLGQQDKKDMIDAGAGYAATQLRDAGGGDSGGGVADLRSHHDQHVQQLLASGSQPIMYGSVHQMEMSSGNCGENLERSCSVFFVVLCYACDRCLLL
jgi:hypothetical protein